MKKPYISAVVAVAPERDCEVMDSLKNMNYPKGKFEVIIKAGKNPSENRNKGIKAARGEIIAFLDDDAVLDLNLFKNAERFFKDHLEIDVVGGPQLTPKDDSFFAKTSGYAIESFFGTFRMSKRYSKGKLELDTDETTLTSANCFVRKKVFSKVAGFDPRLFPGEDPEFFARVKKNGFKLAYSPELVIYHRRRTGFFGFCRQFFNYGKVRLQKEKIGKSLPGLVFFMPSLFLIYLILLPLLVYLFNWWFALPLVFYLIVASLVSFYILFTKRVLGFLLLPFLFLSLHLSYGAGMLYFLLKQ